jgi:hypothetical protein
MIQAGGEALQSEIQKLINSIWNKEIAWSLEGVYYCTSSQEGR